MKRVRYFWVEDGKLKQVDESHRLIQDIPWHKDETLKIENWPFDLKVGPCTQIPYGKPKQTKKDWKEEVLRNTAEYRREKAERPDQKPLIRFDETRTPYSEEFTKRDDARNRSDLSQRIPKGWEDSKETPPQDDAPF